MKMHKIETDQVCLGCVSFSKYIKMIGHQEKYVKWVKDTQDSFIKECSEYMEMK